MPPMAHSLRNAKAQVIRLVAEGQSNREIAQALVISEKTAKAHISNILGKLGLVDRTQLAIYALKNGLADPEGSERKELTCPRRSPPPRPLPVPVGWPPARSTFFMPRCL